MRILPPSLKPWRTRIDRRHEPPPATGRHGYRNYRQCLRWEFGFTCAFCLCHESDFVLHGVDGTGLTQVEHFVPRSHDEARTNEYANCFYVCRFCNGSRGAKRNIDAAGNRLLNPCTDVWGQAFTLSDDEVRAGTSDAVYTRDAYDFNDPRKVRLRRRRRLTIRERLDFLKEGQAMKDRLLDRAAEVRDPELADELIDVARLIEQRLRLAWQDLELFQILPRDLECPCAYGDEDRCSVPAALEEQAIDVEFPL